MIKLSGLWRNVSKEGKVYYSGSVNKACRILVFPNKVKSAEGQPDFEVFLDTSVKREETSTTLGGELDLTDVGVCNDTTV